MSSITAAAAAAATAATHNHSSPPAPTPAPPPVKYKNSCDFCSQSKVRCESQKPKCSRCVKLGHPCCYSVARRVGRRTRNASSARGSQGGRITTNSPRPGTEPLQGAAAPSSMSRHELLRRETSSRSQQQAKKAPQRAYVELAPRAGSVPSLQLHVRSRPSPAEGPPGPSKPDTKAFVSPSHARTNPAARPRAAADEDIIMHDGFPPTSGTIMASPPFDFGGWHDYHQHPDHRQHATTSPSEPASCCRWQSTTVDSIMSAPGSSSWTATAEESVDCMGVVMALQEQLNDASEALRAMGGGGGADGRFVKADFVRRVDAAMEIMGTAYDRLSTVLICPCSGADRLDVGLLVSTVCNSLLDVYSVIISSSSEMPSPDMTETSCSSAAAESFDPDAFHLWNSQASSPNDPLKRDLSSLELRGWENSAAETPLLVRVVEELPKMASVVLHFTKRYRATSRPYSGENPGTGELLYALASYVRVRLQNIKSEVTGLLQCTTGSGMPLAEELL